MERLHHTSFNMRIVLILVFQFSLIFCCTSQTYHFEEPIRLNSNVNQKSEDTYPLYDSENKVLYFARTVHKGNIGGKFSGFDIWFSERQSETFFSRAKNLKELNDRTNNTVIGFMTDFKGLYLQNAFDEIANKSITGISFSKITDEGFSKPQPTSIKSVMNMQNKEFWGAYVNQSNDVLLISMNGPESMGQEDLYVSFKFIGKSKYFDGENIENNSWWSEPIHLGNLNTSYFEISPFLLSDGKTMFFASNRPGGEGDSDIYYSIRLDNTWQNWSEPVNIGPPINTRKFEAYFSMTEDGEVFYSSNAQGGLADIYLTKLKSEDSLAMAEEETLFLDSLNQKERLITFKPNESELLMAHLPVFQEAIEILDSDNYMHILLNAFQDSDSVLVSSRVKNTIEQFHELGVDSTKIAYDPAVFNSIENTVGIKFYRRK